jgi:iron complex transport system ATP-binding protein
MSTQAGDLSGTAPAMRLRGVTVGRRLLDLDLDVHHGEVLALVGANGAGKSTLLGVLAGDILPTSGAVQLRGTPLALLDVASRARMRAVLGQHADAPVPLTAATVLGLAGVPWGGPRPVPPALEAALELAPLLQRSCAELAGGERQRVQIARVCAQLWHVPDGVLLLDEPANHLDVRHQRALVELLRRRAADGQAVVLAVHDLNLALAVADRVAVLHAGRLLREGAPGVALDAATLASAFGVALTLASTPSGPRVDAFAGLP